MSKKQASVFEQMTSTFPPNVTEGWTTMVEKWENDTKAPNPYEELQCGKSLHSEQCPSTGTTL